MSKADSDKRREIKAWDEAADVYEEAIQKGDAKAADEASARMKSLTDYVPLDGSR